MDKQKAIEIMRLAPDGWGCYSEYADSFFCKGWRLWCVFDRNLGSWGVCEPSVRAEGDMMSKSEILKIAEGEEIKNAGDNLVLGCEDSIDNLCDRVAESILKKNPVRLGCEDSKCDEWPCVGEKVTHSVCGLCEVVSPVDSRGVIAVLSEDGFNVLVFKSDLVKPKTPEEELRDWMHERIGYGIASGFDCEQITHDLLHNLNITKKPQ